MSQLHVERVIGLLATDEGVRRRFRANPFATVEEMVGRGMELNECERRALIELDARALERFALAMDSRLQKSDLGGDCS